MKRRSLLGLMLAAPLLAACSAQGNQPAGTGGSGTAAGLLTVGMIPVAHFAPVYIAQQEGLFKAEGLEVKTQVIQNAASIVPSVINGQLSFGTSAGTPFINAVAKNLPVRAVAPAGANPGTPKEDTIGLVVRADGPKTLQDLPGKTMAINAQGAQPHIAAAKVLMDAGIDPKSVNFVAMPMADALAALKQGRIDAAGLAEPFVTIAQNQGDKVLSALYSLAFKGTGMESVYFSSNNLVESNRPEVEAFQRAMIKANELANADSQLLQSILVSKLEMDKDLAAKMVIPTFGTDMDPSTLVEISKVMVETGFLNQEQPGDKLVMS
ncbi:ABC transporter substrate-binding protein [Glutamicibacter sp.]|uniref:ABC transporter substrate-binding protein n=1 Tax=Glutamicibacter sp. TaxID=1931995 RepID=UPI002B47AA12|nr:ABC transporter substrate-binding protein [Glutamicibacter sp.]HJX78351.1 ABC transporter substrate-binding protein [Glutamicibacter sp.]